jgi:hypothetical protein
MARALGEEEDMRSPQVIELFLSTVEEVLRGMLGKAQKDGGPLLSLEVSYALRQAFGLPNLVVSVESQPGEHSSDLQLLFRPGNSMTRRWFTDELGISGEETAYVVYKGREKKLMRSP